MSGELEEQHRGRGREPTFRQMNLTATTQRRMPMHGATNARITQLAKAERRVLQYQAKLRYLCKEGLQGEQCLHATLRLRSCIINISVEKSAMKIVAAWNVPLSSIAASEMGGATVYDAESVTFLALPAVPFPRSLHAFGASTSASSMFVSAISQSSSISSTTPSFVSEA